jgi:hypothetical protein
VKLWKLTIALAVGGALFAATVGFGASLGLTDDQVDQIGAGDALVTSCDTDGVTVNWRTQVQDNADIHGHTGFQVIALELSDISSNCDGQYVLVSITKGGSHYMMGRAANPISGGTAVVDQWFLNGSWQAGGPMVVDIDDIHILIKEHVVAYDGTGWG